MRFGMFRAALVAGVVGGTLAGGAAAQERLELGLTCSFVSECFDSEACSETDFAPELRGEANGLSSADMTLAMRDVASDAPRRGSPRGPSAPAL